MPASRKKKAFDPADLVAKATPTDLRRMYLVGEMLEQLGEEDSEFRDRVADALNCSLKGKEDRELFGLPPEPPIRHRVLWPAGWRARFGRIGQTNEFTSCELISAPLRVFARKPSRASRRGFNALKPRLDRAESTCQSWCRVWHTPCRFFRYIGTKRPLWT